MADTLLREGNPPFGQLACPVPQYWRQDTQSFERVQGEHGASRVILYGPNGQPISSTNPIPVQLNGSKTSLTELLTNTPLAAGVNYTQPWVDAQTEGVVATSLEVYSPTTVIEVALQISSDGVNPVEILRLALFRNRRTEIPPIWLPTRYYRWVLRNKTTTDQTNLLAYHTKHYVYVRQPKSVPAVLIDAFMPTTSKFMNFETHPSLFYSARLLGAGDSTKPVFICNTTDVVQRVNLNLNPGSDAGSFTDGITVFNGDLATGVSVAAGTSVLWTNKDYPGLDVPMIDLILALHTSAATSGRLSAYTIALVG